MNNLMCHVVAGYPDTDTCLELMKGLQDAGAAAIEVQIPFSDPIADGEIIMGANDAALGSGMTTAGSFKLIEKARGQGVECDIYIMSYVQKILHFGFQAFCEAASRCGAKGLIVPDLPHESPEHKELFGLARKYMLELVPVLSPGMSAERLTAQLGSKPPRVYVTSRRGITGNEYSGTKELERLIADISQHSRAGIMIGFGISTLGDVEDALKFGDIAVVGSAIIRRLQDSGVQGTLEYASNLIKGRS